VQKYQFNNTSSNCEVSAIYVLQVSTTGMPCCPAKQPSSQTRLKARLNP